MNIISLCLPVAFLIISVFLSVRFVKHGAKKRTVVMAQILTFVAVCAAAVIAPAIAHAATTAGSAATVAAAATVADPSRGMEMMAAALATGLSCIGGGIAVAASAPAAIGATSEDPKAFGKALIFVALAEGIAIYGLLVSILLLNKVK